MLLQNLRARIGARLNGDREAGFTLIELLVVMLILGILAAIAIPAFFNQRSKANDSQAKSVASTAETAMETCATENGGSYDETACAISGLQAIEPTLKSNPVPTVTAGGNTYTIEVKAESTENVFKIVRDSEGKLTFPCTVASSNRGGCPGTGEEDGEWGPSEA